MDLAFVLRHHGRAEGRGWFLRFLELPSFQSVPGHALVYALPYVDNVASADRILSAAEAAGVLERMGHCHDHSTQAFLSLERRRKGVTRYPREHYWRLTERGRRWIVASILQEVRDHLDGEHGDQRDLDTCQQLETTSSHDGPSSLDTSANVPIDDTSAQPPSRTIGLEPIELSEMLGAGLHRVTIADKTQLWVRAKLRTSRRKTHRFCWCCGTHLQPGTLAYWPLTNDLNRMRRLCPRCVEVTS